MLDPVLGTELVRVDSTGLNLPEAFEFAREQGGQALRKLTYRERAAILSAVVKLLQSHRDAYYEIATANSGTVKNDSAVDIDGGIFTLGTYAKLHDCGWMRRCMIQLQHASLGRKVRRARRESGSRHWPSACTTRPRFGKESVCGGMVA